MSSNGWIKAHRKMLDWEWYDDSKIVHLYLHCLLKANHKPNKWRGILIESGQFVTSYKTLSCELPMSVQQIRTALKKLKSTGELTVKKCNKYSTISITNWDDYQLDNKQDNKQVTINQQTNNKQVTTNKNVKKEKNDKNKHILDYSAWPSIPDKQILKDWQAMRKKKKADITQTVINAIGKQLSIASDQGISVDDCLTEIIVRNWTGFKADWMNNQNNNNNGFSKNNEPPIPVEFKGFDNDY